MNISLPGGILVASDAAALTVTEDTIAPVLRSATALGTVVALEFDEALDAVAAADISKYTVAGASVLGAELQADGTTVLLTLDTAPGASFNVTANGVADLENNIVNMSVTGAASSMTFTDLGVVPEPSRGYSTGPGEFTVYARGTDIWGTADSGNFIWEERTGDFDVKVQLASFTAAAISANAGLMARENLTEGSRNIQIVTYANQSLWVSAERPEQDAASRVTAGDWDVVWPAGTRYPNVWLRLKRAGNTFTMYGGTNGVDWIQVGAAVTPTTSFPDTILVGMRTTPVEVQAPGTTGIAQYLNYGDVTSNTEPRLTLQRSGNQLVISWPTATGAGFTLESTSALGSAWTPVNTPPVVEGATTRVTLAINPSGNQFFRLKR